MLLCNLPEPPGMVTELLSILLLRDKVLGWITVTHATWWAVGHRWRAQSIHLAESHCTKWSHLFVMLPRHRLPQLLLPSCPLSTTHKRRLWLMPVFLLSSFCLAPYSITLIPKCPLSLFPYIHVYCTKRTLHHILLQKLPKTACHWSRNWKAS